MDSGNIYVYVFLLSKFCKNREKLENETNFITLPWTAAFLVPRRWSKSHIPPIRFRSQTHSRGRRESDEFQLTMKDSNVNSRNTFCYLCQLFHYSSLSQNALSVLNQRLWGYRKRSCPPKQIGTPGLRETVSRFHPVYLPVLATPQRNGRTEERRGGKDEWVTNVLCSPGRESIIFS